MLIALPTRTPRADLPALLENFAAIHDSMLRDSAALPAAISRVDSRRSVRALLRWYDRFAHAIETHHQREDGLVWPDLVGRSPGFADELARLEEDHADLDIALSAVREALAAERFDRFLAIASANRLADLLDAHLSREEQAAFGRIAEAYTAEEYAVLEERIMADSSVADLAFDLPWVVESLTPERRQALEAEVPALVRWVNRLVFTPRYRSLSAPIRKARSGVDR